MTAALNVNYLLRFIFLSFPFWLLISVCICCCFVLNTMDGRHFDLAQYGADDRLLPVNDLWLSTSACPQHQILTVIVGSDLVTLVILISSCSLFAVIQTFLISKTVLMCFVILRWFEASVFPWIIQCSSPSSRYWYWRNSTMAALPAVRPQCQSAVSRLYNYKSSAT